MERLVSAHIHGNVEKHSYLKAHVGYLRTHSKQQLSMGLLIFE
jgi:hypothetical protein